MPSPRQQSTCGPKNALHKAAFLGSTRSTLALLSQGSFDVNQGCEDGTTPLMLASYNDSPGVVRALLDAGAVVSMAKDDGITALFSAADSGSLEVTKILAEAGADLEAPVIDGGTSLHLAAEEGHTAVVGALVEAGAKTGSRRRDGATPLYLAAREGRTEVVRVLLRAKADPLLAFMNHANGATFIPLDAAAMFGHSGVLRELLKQAGIRGCGGATGGYNAFRLASLNQRVDIMAMLTDAGVVDSGEALLSAVEHGHVAAARFLVKQFGGKAARRGEKTYLDARDAGGRTPLHKSLEACRPGSPRIMRLLIDAGADTSTPVRVDTKTTVAFLTPLAYVTQLRDYQKRDSSIVSEQQWQTIEAIRSLLLRKDAIHATSWVWPRAVPSKARAVDGCGRTKTPSTSLGMTLPTLRRRTESRRRTLVRTMFRCVVALCNLKGLFYVPFAVAAVGTDAVDAEVTAQQRQNPLPSLWNASAVALTVLISLPCNVGDPWPSRPKLLLLPIRPVLLPPSSDENQSIRECLG